MFPSRNASPSIKFSPALAKAPEPIFPYSPHPHPNSRETRSAKHRKNSSALFSTIFPNLIYSFDVFSYGCCLACLCPEYCCCCTFAFFQFTVSKSLVFPLLVHLAFALSSVIIKLQRRWRRWHPQANRYPLHPAARESFHSLLMYSDRNSVSSSPRCLICLFFCCASFCTFLVARRHTQMHNQSFLACCFVEQCTNSLNIDLSLDPRHRLEQIDREE